MESFVTIGTGNSKLGIAIPSINLPAITTCRSNAPCKKGCYALKGSFQFPNPKESAIKNLNNYKANPKLYFDTIVVQTSICKFVRWHSSGDIVDMQYFEGIINVAKRNKSTNYLCFTKKYEIINDYLSQGKKIPKNLNVVFSNWDNFVCDNPYNLPTTWVYSNKFNLSLIPEIAIPCVGKCYECQACWQLKKGQSVYFKKH
jgi:hypothetical protein